MWETRAHVVVSFAKERLEQTIPEALIVLGISCAGIVLGWIFYRIGDCCTYHKRERGHEKLIEEMKSRSRFRRGAVVRVIFMLLAIASVLVGLTIGFNAAGFNFWTIALGGGFLTLVATYSFGSSLQSATAYFLLNLSEKIEDDWVVELVGLPVKGTVVAIHILWVELQYEDESGEVVEFQVPTHLILSNVIKRYVGHLGSSSLKKKAKEQVQGVRLRKVDPSLNV